MLHFLNPFILFVSWLLSLLVSLSVPIIHTIFLWEIKLHASASILNFTGADITGKVTFGLWGYCVSQIQGRVLGFSDSTSAQCTRASVGLHVDNNLAQLLNIKDAENTINQTLTAVLVLHPVTCALTFLALLAALHTAWRPSRRGSLAVLIFAGLATLTGTIVFIIDVVVVAVSKKDLAKATDDVLDITWGNAVWMSLGALIGLWIACFGACCGICACGGRFNRGRKWDEKY